MIVMPAMIGAQLASWHGVLDAVGDPAKARHRFDFAALAALIAARDFRDVELSRKDRQRLRDMLSATRADSDVMSGSKDASDALSRLERAAGLG